MFLVVVLQIPPARIMIDVEAGAGGLGSSAPDTASDDEALGPVVVEAVLPMPPVVTGADFPGCFAPDTANYDKTLGPVLQDALLRIPLVGLLY